MNRKPGDWNCSTCDHLNFGWRDSCQKCGYRKAAAGGLSSRLGDRRTYDRGSRLYGNYDGRGGSGYAGRYERGGDVRDRYGGGGGGVYGTNYGENYGAIGSDVRPGDWYCPVAKCGTHNFASRSSCFRCGEAREEMQEYSRYAYESFRGGFDSERKGYGSSYSSGNGGGTRTAWRSGDWVCTRSGCNEHNFASRMECFRCQAPKETGSSV